jgi:hypothetical protein
MIQGDITWIDPCFMQAYMPDENLPFLEGLIEDVEFSTRWAPALTGTGEDSDMRDSDILWFNTDNPPPRHEPVLHWAQETLNHYLKEQPWATNGCPDFSAAEYSVLRYKKGQGYHAAHADAAPWGTAEMARRHLTQLIFLNDVDEGGELEYPIQDVTFLPRKGKCLIHPSGWTHSHRMKPAVDTKYALVVFYAFISEQPSPSITYDSFVKGK